MGCCAGSNGCIGSPSGMAKVNASTPPTSNSSGGSGIVRLVSVPGHVLTDDSARQQDIDALGRQEAADVQRTQRKPRQILACPGRRRKFQRADTSIGPGIAVRIVQPAIAKQGMARVGGTKPIEHPLTRFAGRRRRWRNRLNKLALRQLRCEALHRVLHPRRINPYRIEAETKRTVVVAEIHEVHAHEARMFETQVDRFAGRDQPLRNVAAQPGPAGDGRPNPPHGHWRKHASRAALTPGRPMRGWPKSISTVNGVLSMRAGRRRPLLDETDQTWLDSCPLHPKVR